MKINNKLENFENDFNLNQIFSIIKRQKKIFFGFTGLFFTVFFIFGYGSKSVWEGYFDIVIKDESPSLLDASLSLADNALAQGFLNSGSRKTLRTELEVIKSPSVLRPIYNHVKEYYKQKGKDTSRWTYRQWVSDKLPIKRLNRSNVIRVSFRDKDKVLILETIGKASKAYQEYSLKDKRINLANNLEYFNEIVTKLELKASKSMNAAQSFSLDNDLGFVDGLLTEQKVELPKELIPIESKIFLLKNELNRFKKELKDINQSEIKGLFYFKKYSKDQKLAKNYIETKALLAEKSLLLKDDDPTIKFLNLKINSLGDFLLIETKNLMNTLISNTEARISSLSRPREVFLKHKELVNAAIRDEIALRDAQAMLNFYELNQSKIIMPWDLITEPQLFEKPIGPRKLRITAAGLLLGLIVGFSLAVIKDRRNGKIYELNELIYFLPKYISLTYKLKSNDIQNLVSSLKIYINKLKKLSKSQDLSILPVGDIDKDFINKIKKILQADLPSSKVFINDDFVVPLEINNILLISYSGKANRENINSIIEKLNVQKFNHLSWIHFED